jgi:hypothetical protein
VAAKNVEFFRRLRFSPSFILLRSGGEEDLFVRLPETGARCVDEQPVIPNECEESRFLPGVEMTDNWMHRDTVGTGEQNLFLPSLRGKVRMGAHESNRYRKILQRSSVEVLDGHFF